MDALQIIGDVQKLSLKPGDKIVLRVNHTISSDAAAQIKLQAEKFFEGFPCVVLGDGMTVEVVTEE